MDNDFRFISPHRNFVLKCLENGVLKMPLSEGDAYIAFLQIVIHPSKSLKKKLFHDGNLVFDLDASVTEFLVI